MIAHEPFIRKILKKQNLWESQNITHLKDQKDCEHANRNISCKENLLFVLREGLRIYLKTA